MNQHRRSVKETWDEERVAAMKPPVCLCGWPRPTSWAFSEDEKGTRPLEVEARRFYVLFKCPQCGARWHALMEKVD